MRGRAGLLAALTLIAATSSTQAQDLATGAAAIRDRALADATAWNLVESLTTEIGPRPAGSPALARAKDWAIAKLTALGFVNVRAEPFEAEAWIRGEERAEVTAPYPQPLHVVGLGRSTSTP